MIFNLSLSLRTRLASKLSASFKVGVSVIFAVLIQACATKPALLSKVDSIEQLENWNARGKLLLKNNKDKLSGYFFWQQKRDGNFKLVITSFIGTNLMTLNYSDGSTDLKIDGKSYQGQHPELLVYQLTGSYIPVRNLAQWMLAQAPKNAEKSMKAGKLSGFTYKDSNNKNWQVKYQTYKSVAELSLPEKITIEGLNNRIKLTINDWELLAQ